MLGVTIRNTTTNTSSDYYSRSSNGSKSNRNATTTTTTTALLIIWKRNGSFHSSSSSRERATASYLVSVSSSSSEVNMWRSTNYSGGWRHPQLPGVFFLVFLEQPSCKSPPRFFFFLLKCLSLSTFWHSSMSQVIARKRQWDPPTKTLPRRDRTSSPALLLS